MATATSNKTKMSLRLMVHQERKKVIFAEADSNFVDTLFSFMTLPLGTIVRLLEKRPDEKVKALGSLGNLYKSLMNLPDIYLSTEESKFVMLNPRSSSFDLCRKLILNIDDTELVKYFVCSQCISPGGVFSTCNLARCSKCGNLMRYQLTVKDSTSNTRAGILDDSVFVSSVTTFIVTDDLHVMPNTSGFLIQLLQQYGITDASHLEEKILSIDLKQILMLLNSALIFKHPLTYMLFARTDYVQVLNYVGQESLVHHSMDNKIGTSSKKMTLKLYFQKSTSKILFAEADSDFVDFLFGFLEIPLGTVIGKLFNGSSSLQSMDNLYASISNKPVGECIKSHNLKYMLLEPQLVLKYSSKSQIFPVRVLQSSFYVTPEEIPFCKFLNWGLKDPRVQQKYLKLNAKFMLTDDLIMTPLSSTSTLSLLSKLKIPISDVEEHDVVIGIEEGLKILKASLKSVSTLTDALVEEIVKNKI